jgi:desulfoferrodoxin (superoxide reductase-like protein)
MDSKISILENNKKGDNSHCSLNRTYKSDSTPTKAHIRFADAFCQMDILAISEMLADDGVFNVPRPFKNRDEVPMDCDKQTFINWLSIRFSQIAGKAEISYTTDICLFCIAGQAVLIFNEGYFPWVPLDMADNAKAGLALSSEKDKIREIQFCFSLMTTENNYFFNDYSKAYQADWKEEKHVRFIDKPEIIENLWRDKYWWVNDENSLKY